MPADESVQLETDRFLLHEVAEDELGHVHLILQSNPEFLAIRGDLAGYDLASVKRYWDLARLDPARHLLLVAVKETGAPLGFVDFVDRSPADGLPWIGLVVIHRSRQRRGAGSEAVTAVASHLASQGHPSVRMAVMEEDEAALGFAHSLGFTGYRIAETSESGAGRRVVLMELSLSSGDV